jgi:hypothetical protein
MDVKILGCGSRIYTVLARRGGCQQGVHLFAWFPNVSPERIGRGKESAGKGDADGVG